MDSAETPQPDLLQRDAVESIDELGVILRRKGEWPAAGMKLGDRHPASA
ncbi:MAG TPA: hypothetical protein VGZ73_28460 [Bryobacteraceae bacterium]|nr:hypothetical protein [Bryobacteraceae bacterium]